MGGETTNDQTRDDMWMNMFYADTSCDILSNNMMWARMKVSRRSLPPGEHLAFVKSLNILGITISSHLVFFLYQMFPSFLYLRMNL